MMRLFTALACMLIAGHAVAAPCNKDTAQDVQLMIREFATWRLEGDHLAVHWTYAIEKLPKEKRLQMVTRYADMDACLRGSAFEILFYRKNRIMGIASPTSGIKLVD